MTTERKVIQIISNHLGVDMDAIARGRRIADLGADSLDLVEIAMDVEDSFGIEMLSDAEIENMETVGDLVDTVEGRLRAKA